MLPFCLSSPVIFILIVMKMQRKRDEIIKLLTLCVPYVHTFYLLKAIIRFIWMLGQGHSSDILVAKRIVVLVKWQCIGCINLLFFTRIGQLRTMRISLYSSFFFSVRFSLFRHGFAFPHLAIFFPFFRP